MSYEHCWQPLRDVEHYAAEEGQVPILLQDSGVSYREHALLGIDTWGLYIVFWDMDGQPHKFWDDKNPELFDIDVALVSDSV